MRQPLSSACRVSIRPDGTTVFTDLWDKFGLTSSSPRSTFSLETSPESSSARPIGVLNYGVLHGEEPRISGPRGTGAVYIHGCPLRCTTCYQPEFFSRRAPSYTAPENLADLMIDFEKSGVHSISVIISTFQENVYEAICMAKKRGLHIPVVYKYSGQLSFWTLMRLSGVVDVFLPDLKAISPALMARHGLPPNYSSVAVPALKDLMQSGLETIVRHLLVPDFKNSVEEVGKMFELLPFARTKTPLSLLTQFYDPLTQAIQSVEHETLSSIEALAAHAGVTLIVPGKGDYVSYTA